MPLNSSFQRLSNSHRRTDENLHQDDFHTYVLGDLVFDAEMYLTIFVEQVEDQFGLGLM